MSNNDALNTTTYTGQIRRLDKDYIQIMPFLGFWLASEHYEYISQHYQVGDSITLTSDSSTGFVTKVEVPT